MKQLQRLSALILVLVALISMGKAIADEAKTTTVAEIQSRWAMANFSDENTRAVAMLEDLAEYSETKFEADPENTDLIIWSAIVQSSLANKKGGISALSRVKKAKKRLELALEQDPLALNGGAYASLGVLYQKVPGWPIGFGNMKKAKENLEKALQIDPDGLNSNFFYADYLADKKEWQLAKNHLEKAIQAPPLVNQPLADKGRRKEIGVLLAKVEQKLR